MTQAAANSAKLLSTGLPTLRAKTDTSSPIIRDGVQWSALMLATIPTRSTTTTSISDTSSTPQPCSALKMSLSKIHTVKS